MAVFPAGSWTSFSFQELLLHQTAVGRRLRGRCIPITRCWSTPGIVRISHTKHRQNQSPSWEIIRRTQETFTQFQVRHTCTILLRLFKLPDHCLRLCRLLAHFTPSGLDYVAHEDIMPYSTSDKSPIQHELFDKFLQLRETEEPLPQAAGEGSTDSIETSKSGSLRALTDVPKRDLLV